MSSELVSGCYRKACDASDRKFTSAGLLAVMPIRGWALRYLVGVSGLDEESLQDDENARLMDKMNSKMISIKEPVFMIVGKRNLRKIRNLMGSPTHAPWEQHPSEK